MNPVKKVPMASAEKKRPIIMSIPHASTFVPASIRKMMLISDFEIHQQSDLYTDEIYDVPNAYVVKAGISRVVADPNRAPDDIEMEYRLGSEGVIISTSENGNPIYKDPPSVDAIFERIEKYHNTFHTQIDAYASDMKFLIDGHSLRSVGPAMKHDSGKMRAEVSIGNREYTTCSREITLKAVKFFKDKGFEVKVNDPYSGKYVLGYHCSRKGLPGFQIELRRDLYMNEETLEPYPKKIKMFNTIMHELVEFLWNEIQRIEEMQQKRKQ